MRSVESVEIAAEIAADGAVVIALPPRFTPRIAARIASAVALAMTSVTAAGGGRRWSLARRSASGRPCRPPRCDGELFVGSERYAR
jgi:hypothetical protein